MAVEFYTITSSAIWSMQLVNFDNLFTQVFFLVCDWWGVIHLCNCLATNRRHSIIWTNDDPFQRRIYTALKEDKQIWVNVVYSMSPINTNNWNVYSYQNAVNIKEHFFIIYPHIILLTESSGHFNIKLSFESFDTIINCGVCIQHISTIHSHIYIYIHIHKYVTYIWHFWVFIIYTCVHIYIYIYHNSK